VNSLIWCQWLMYLRDKDWDGERIKDFYRTAKSTNRID
jgi:hypothetical protein